jgi:CheY-like chemotaxis protein
MTTSELILVVDPDPAILRDVASMLTPNGYTVLVARHGTEAIRVCERCKSPIDLLMTSVMMPGLSGFDVAESLTQWNRNLGVVFMSEDNREILFAENARSSSSFLRKPFTEQSLLEKVRGALTGRSQPIAVVGSQIAAFVRTA